MGELITVHGGGAVAGDDINTSEATKRAISEM